METKLFGDFVQSLKEAKAISKGKARASRRFKFQTTDVRATDVKRIREGVGLTQDEFAKLMRV